MNLLVDKFGKNRKKTLIKQHYFLIDLKLALKKKTQNS